MTVTHPDTGTTADADGVERQPRRRGGRRVEISVAGLALGAGCAVLLLACAVLAVLLHDAREDRDRDRATAADSAHAEQVARDYAVGAATVDHQHLDAWLTNLKAGTTPALAAKFDATAATLGQILEPLRWKSSATPITAKVTAENDGVYTVSAFVDVTSTSAQNAEGAQTTVTYTVTVDKNAGWMIADVGGLDGAMPAGK